MTAWTSEVDVRVEVSSAAPDADPVWVDITPWVRTTGRGGPIDIARGAQTVLQTFEPARMTLVLDNADSRFTSGNTTSPYYPWWKEHRRVRVRETVGSKTFDLFTGYVEMPVVTETIEGRDNLVTIAAVASVCTHRLLIHLVAPASRSQVRPALSRYF